MPSPQAGPTDRMDQDEVRRVVETSLRESGAPLSEAVTSAVAAAVLDAISSAEPRRHTFGPNAQALLLASQRGLYPFPPDTADALRSGTDRICGLYLTLGMHARALRKENQDLRTRAEALTMTVARPWGLQRNARLTSPRLNTQQIPASSYFGGSSESVRETVNCVGREARTVDSRNSRSSHRRLQQLEDTKIWEDTMHHRLAHRDAHTFRHRPSTTVCVTGVSRIEGRELVLVYVEVLIRISPCMQHTPERAYASLICRGKKATRRKEDATESTDSSKCDKSSSCGHADDYFTKSVHVIQ